MSDKVFTVVYMIVITAVATALMTGANMLLEERIELNERLLEHRAQLRALGLLGVSERADAETVDALFRARVKRQDRDGRKLFLAYARDGKTVDAIGLEFEGQGYWGPISGIVSVDPSDRKIVALYFLEHRETPGLGGRIMAPWFLEQFKGKGGAEPDEEGRRLVFLAEGAEARGSNEVNAISGATRTSDSMRKILNEALRDLHEALGQME